MKKFTIPGKVRQLNATIIAPENAGLRIVLNSCAQSGKFDSPLEALLTKRWAKVREDYNATQFNFKPGFLNNTAVASDTWVVNMLVKDKDGNLNADALKLAVKKLAEQVKSERGSSVHVSMMLLEEAPQLQDLLMTSLVEEGVNVYYYKEPEKV
jgi:hypothetical protein